MKKLLLSAFLLFFSFAGRAQSLPNGGFENWTMTTFLEPDNWAIQLYGAEQTVDAHSGNYAVTIHNWYYYGEGYVGNGYTDSNYSHYGAPYTEKPLYLTGYYKYDTLGSGNMADSAYGVVMLRKWNTVTGLRDTVAMGEIKLGLSHAYKLFQVNVADLAPGVMPDSIEVIFVSCVESSCMCSGSTNGECLYLSLDDLELVTPTGVQSLEDLEGRAKIAPNPFSERAEVYMGDATSEYSVKMYDITGRQVRQWNGVKSKLLIERNELQPGIYFLDISNSQNKTEQLKLTIE